MDPIAAPRRRRRSLSMNICPHCGTGSPDPEFCLECGVKIDHRHHGGDDLPDRELQSRAVYKAPDELSAVTLREVLESEGIRSWVQSIQVPWYDGIMQMVEGYWGKVMVFEDQETEARSVIDAYLKSLGPGLH
jgi:hypothetical protein